MLGSKVLDTGSKAKPLEFFFGNRFEMVNAGYSNATASSLVNHKMIKTQIAHATSCGTTSDKANSLNQIKVRGAYCPEQVVFP